MLRTTCLGLLLLTLVLPVDAQQIKWGNDYSNLAVKPPAAQSTAWKMPGPHLPTIANLTSLLPTLRFPGFQPQTGYTSMPKTTFTPAATTPPPWASK